jgi:hypothetical protein
MRNIELRVRTLEAMYGGGKPILIAVSPGETNEEALARSGKGKANLTGCQMIYVHTGVPRPDINQGSGG